MTQTLAGKKGLVVGIANEHSIAWGCAKAFQTEGAELAVTYLNVKAEPYVRPLAQQLGASVILPLDVRDDAQMEAVFNAVKAKWGTLDFLLHAIILHPLKIEPPIACVKSRVRAML
jgi:enoyl-[acyl-carrier protein] reductase I